MIGFLKSVFSKGESGEKLLDAGIKGIDALYFTEEEKSVASHQLLSTFIDFQKATQAQNVARRWIAFGVTLLWMILVLILAGLGWAGYDDAYKAIYAVMKEFVFIPFSGIMTFYFLTHVLRARK